MVKKKAKKQAKRKKAQKESSIRTDVWQLAMTQEQRQLAILTVAEYRHFLKPLALIGYWNWEKLSQLTSNERVNTLEKLVHKTADNPRTNTLLKPFRGRLLSLPKNIMSV